MITYQVEDLTFKLMAEADPLLRAHYEEVSTEKHIKVFDPDYDKYVELGELGMIRVMTVRNNGDLIGYFVCIVNMHLHYQQTQIALNDILYVHPNFRGTRVAYQMLKMGIQDLKNLNCDILIIHMKVDYPFRRMLEKLDFNLSEENWELVL